MTPSYAMVLVAGSSVFLGLAGISLAISLCWDLEWQRDSATNTLESRLLENQYG